MSNYTFNMSLMTLLSYSVVILYSLIKKKCTEKIENSTSPKTALCRVNKKDNSVSKE